jgi:hypothetical protein
VTDGHDEDRETREHPAARPAPAGEGVRIIGAEEAQAALDSGLAGRRIADSEPRFGDVPARPDPEVRPDLSFPRSDAVDAPAADEPTAEHPDLVGAVADALAGDDVSTPDAIEEPAPPAGLPHWTEPATGEVPVILGGDEDAEPSGEFPAAPRFRSGGADWDEDELETFRVLGAEPEDEIPLSARELPPEDDDVAFDREVAARRVRTAAAGPRPKPRPRPSRDDDEMGLGGDRPDMLVRVVTALGMAALALLCLNAGTDATMVLATAIVAICTFELYSALHARGFRPAAIIGLLGAVTIVPLAYERAEFAFPFVFAMVTIFTLLWFVFEVVHTRPMVNVAVTIGGFMYTAGLGAFAGLLLTSANGVGLILGVAIPVIAYDVFGYSSGSRGSRPRSHRTRRSRVSSAA